ncbi:MAG: GNAT family N-acetyltransferase [Pseudomonadota bacterium]
MTPRALTPADAPALVPLIEGLAAFHGDTPSATMDAIARDLRDDWLWGFGIGTPFVGYALLLRHGQAQFGLRGADLHHIFVAEEHRRKGHGAALIRAAEASARARGCDYIVIGAHNGNVAARDAYLSLGYVFREPRPWRFRKRLAPN